MVAERGWEQPSAAAGLLAHWEQAVGPELAAHCAATSLVDGELVVVAESSAWATQLRLLMGTLLTQVRAYAGAGAVRTIVVRGPAQADWRHGSRRVQGRGPRDTYG